MTTDEGTETYFEIQLDRGTVLLLGVVFLAVLYPALKAAMIQPMDAIHHR